MSTWYEVKEHLPEEGKLILLYSAVFKEYSIGKWSPYQGWVNQHGKGLQVVTHWLDFDFNFSFEISEEPDEELAEKYGVKIMKGLFGRASNE